MGDLIIFSTPDSRYTLLKFSGTLVEETMADDQTLSRLLGTLYAAPTTPELWVDFLREVCAQMGASNGALIAHDTRTDEHHIFGSLGESIRESSGLYVERYWEFDEWTKRGLLRVGTGQVMIGSDVWPQREFLGSTFYNEFLKQFDIRSVASVATGSVPGEFEALSIYRGPENDGFDIEDIALLEVLLPHLKIAMATRRRIAGLESRIAGCEAAFELIKYAMVLLDKEARVVLINSEARSILEQDRSFSWKDSRLVPKRQEEAAKLRGLIAMATATATSRATPGGAMSIFRAGMKPLQIIVSPLRSEGASVLPRAVVAVFLNDPERSRAIPTELLRTLFGLTPAEARLALCLLDGKSLSDSAELNCVSRETVKSQISSIFLKTGARRQSELVSLLAHLPFAAKVTID